MRILLLHNYYQQGGGEDTVVEAERKLLQEHGNDVNVFSVSNDEIRSTFGKIRSACFLPYSIKAKLEVAREISRFLPDLVHVHNFFPLFTPSIYDACQMACVPVVQTLHNFRIICPGALLMRRGNACEECLHGSPYRAALHFCYRKSLLGSLAVARMVAFHRSRRTWQDKVDRFIALTEFAKTRFVMAGFPAEKICVKPNFAQNPTSALNSGARQGALFVGRLSPEKGIKTLLAAWRQLDVPMRIAGDGPLMESIQNADIRNLVTTGKLNKDIVASEMDNAAFLIMPSEWYEGFPMVLVEAFSHGLPVIASRLGSMAEIVVDGLTGILFEAGNADDLATKVRWAVEHPDEMRVMGEKARKDYERKYTSEVNYQQLMAIYEGAIKSKEKEGGHH
jgi:glycosyltransferase involved in cell wall biosynthesis